MPISNRMFTKWNLTGYCSMFSVIMLITLLNRLVNPFTPRTTCFIIFKKLFYLKTGNAEKMTIKKKNSLNYESNITFKISDLNFLIISMLFVFTVFLGSHFVFQCSLYDKNFTIFMFYHSSKLRSPVLPTLEYIL